MFCQRHLEVFVFSLGKVWREVFFMPCYDFAEEFVQDAGGGLR